MEQGLDIRSTEMADQCENCGKKVKTRCARCQHAGYCSKGCMDRMKDMHQRMCYPLDKKLVDDKNNRVLREALAMNMFREFMALETEKQSGKKQSLFNQGRYAVFKGFIGLIMKNPRNCEPSESQMEAMKQGDVSVGSLFCHLTLIKQGGRILYADMGMEGMHDPLLTLFMPDDCLAMLNYIWDGIGEWKA